MIDHWQFILAGVLIGIFVTPFLLALLLALVGIRVTLGRKR